MSASHAQPGPAGRVDLRRLARSGGFAIGGVVASAVLQFALVVTVTRGLPKASAGAFLEAIALFLILSNWGELGADTGAVRLIPRLRAQGRDGEVKPMLRAALVPVWIFGIAAAVVLSAAAGPLSDVLFGTAGRGSGVELLRVMAPAVPLASVLTVTLAATRGYGHLRPYVLITNVVVPGVRLAAVAAAIVLAGGSPTLLGLAYGAPLVVCLVVAHRSLSRDVAATEPLAADQGRVRREFWAFSAPRGLAVGFGIGVQYLDVLLVGAISGTHNAAIYAAISRLSAIGAYVLQAVGVVVAPQFSALQTVGDLSRLEHLYQVATWWTLVACAPVYLVMAVYAPVCARLFGNGYGAGATALAILAVAGLVNLGTGNVMILLLMAGRSAWNLFDVAGSLSVNVVLNLILIPRYGITGAAVAWAISIIGTNVVALVQVHSLLGVRPFGRGYLPAVVAPVVCFGVGGVIVRAAVGGGVVEMLASSLVGAICYVAAIMKLRSALQLPQMRMLLSRSRPVAG